MGLLSTIGSASGRAFGLTRVAGAIKDAYFNLVTLLLPGNGTNGAQNNTFLDSSSNAFSITRNGNTTQGTFTPFSQTGWSNYFPGTSGNDLSIADSSLFEFTGDFTIEAFIYPTVLNTYNAIIAHWQPGTASGCSFAFSVNSSNRLVFGYGIGGTTASDVIGTSTSVSLNTWTHVCVSRNSGTIRLFVNGTQDSTTRTGATGTLNNSPNNIYVGSNTGVDLFTGYISNLRVLSGTGVTSVTVPTSPLTNITNTIFLTCQSNRFVDNGTANSGSGFPYAYTGSSVSVQAFSPFAPASAYSASVVGGSGYFNGSGDYLSWSGTTFGTSAFTIEGWFYLSSIPTGGTSFFGLVGNNGTINGLNFRIASSTSINLDNSVTGQAFTVPTLVVNTWYHIAAVRNASNQATIFLNGARSSTGAVSITWNLSAASTYVGNHNDGSNHYYNGYMSGLRVVAGSNVYDPTQTTITIPTSPPTAITNTSLLLNFTNAGITDATAKNDLETVGNAQISTTQSKFGGSSMYFDGTGDYLLFPNSQNFALGSGDFTVEAWVYLSASKLQAIMDTRLVNSNTTGIALAIDASNYPYVYVNNATLFTSSTAISLTTWTHLAMVRSSGTITLYINGTKPTTGSASNSTNLTDTALTVGSVIDYRDTTATLHFNGYIDDLRITKGYARYTSNFTAPTSAFALQ